jgi:hypothetical protein
VTWEKEKVTGSKTSWRTGKKSKTENRKLKTDFQPVAHRSRLTYIKKKVQFMAESADENHPGSGR